MPWQDDGVESHAGSIWVALYRIVDPRIPVQYVLVMHESGVTDAKAVRAGVHW